MSIAAKFLTIAVSVTAVFFLEGCKKKNNSSSTPMADTAPPPDTSNACSVDAGAELELMLKLASETRKLDARSLKISGVDAYGEAFNGGLRTVSVGIYDNPKPGKEAGYFRVRICDTKGVCTPRIKAVSALAHMCVGREFGQNLSIEAWACLDEVHRKDGTKQYECNGSPTKTRILVKPAKDRASDNAAKICENITKGQGAASELAHKVSNIASEYLKKSAGGSDNQQREYFRTIASSMVNKADQFAKVFSDANLIGEMLIIGAGGSSTSSESQIQDGLSLTQDACGSDSGEADALRAEKDQLATDLAAKQAELDAAIAAADAEKEALQQQLDTATTDGTTKDETITELNEKIDSITAEQDLLNEQLLNNQVSGPADGRLIVSHPGTTSEAITEILQTEYIMPFEMRKENMSVKSAYLNDPSTGVPVAKQCLQREGDSLNVAKCAFDVIGGDFPISKASQILSIRLAGDGLGHFRIVSDGRCLSLRGDEGARKLEFEDCRESDTGQNFTFEYLDNELKKAQIKIKSDGEMKCLTKSSPVGLQACGAGDQQFYISNIFTARASENVGVYLPDELAWLHGRRGDDRYKAWGFGLLMIGGAVTALAGVYTSKRWYQSVHRSGNTKAKKDTFRNWGEHFVVKKGNVSLYDAALAKHDRKLIKAAAGKNLDDIRTIDEVRYVTVSVQGKKYLVARTNESNIVKSLGKDQNISGLKTADIQKLPDVSRDPKYVKQRQFGNKGKAGLLVTVLSAMVTITGTSWFWIQSENAKNEDEYFELTRSNPEAWFQDKLGEVMEQLRQLHLGILELETKFTLEACAADGNKTEICKQLAGI